MRIAFIHNLGPGGAHRTMAEHMRRLDGEVQELCLETATPVRDDALVVGLRRRAAEVTALLRPPLRHTDLLATVHSWERLARVVRQRAPDVVVAHPCRFLQCPPPLRRLGAPTVYFCHEPRRVDHDPLAAARRSRRTARLYGAMYAAERRLDMQAVAAAGALVTNSRFTAAAIARAYGRDATVIRMGVADVFTAAGGGERPAAHILSVGALIPGKGHELVIAAAGRARRRLPVVVVAPRAEPVEQARLEHVARACRVELRLAIAISDDELRDLYRGALATLYLAESEPLGLAAMEAQACGCPVIVSAEGGLPETVDPGRSGWAVPRDPAAAAAKLDMLESPQLLASARAAAGAHGASFSWDASTRDLEAVIERAAPR